MEYLYVIFKNPRNTYYMKIPLFSFYYFRPPFLEPQNVLLLIDLFSFLVQLPVILRAVLKHLVTIENVLVSLSYFLKTVIY